MSDLERTQPRLAAEGGGRPHFARRFVRFAWRAKRLLVLLPLLAAGIVFAYCQSWLGALHPQLEVVPLYRATAELFVEVEAVDPGTGAAVEAPAPRTTLNHLAQLFASRSLLEPLAEVPAIHQLPSIRRQQDRPVVDVLAEFLRAEVDETQGRLSVSYEAPDREDAVVIVRHALEVFDAHQQDAARQRFDRDVVLVTEQMQAAEEALDALRAEATAKREELGITGEQLDNPHTAEVERLSEDLRKVERELLSAELRLEQSELSSATPEKARAHGRELRAEAPKALFEADIESLQAQKQDKQKELAVEEARSDADHAQLQGLRREIEALDRSIDAVYVRYATAERDAAKRDHELALRTQARFEAELEEARASYFALETGLDELRRLEERREARAEDRRKFADVIAALELAERDGGVHATVFDPPRASSRPVHPATWSLTLYGALVGLLVALAFVAVRAVGDHRVWSPEDVPRALGASVVGVFPSLRARSSEAVGRVVQGDPGSLAAEAVRSMRTATSFALGEEGEGIVLVTSAESGEGKSIASSNLALAFAQSGRSTLLVDADLRKPGQNVIFDLIGKRGLGDAIAGDVEWEGAVVQQVQGELDLLPAGAAERGAAELLESRACRELFAELRRRYDVVVVDSSPVLETAEARVLSRLADATLLVMRLQVSSAPSARRAMGILQSVGGNVIGAFVNGGSQRRKGRAYAEGISYGGPSSPARPMAPAPDPEPYPRRPEGSAEAWS